MPTFNLSQLELLQDSFIQLAVLLSCMALLIFAGRTLPSKRGLVFFLLPVPLFFLGFWFPTTQVILDLYNVLFFLTCLVDRFLLSAPPGQIELNRHLQAKFSIHQDNRILLGVINNSTSPLRGFLTDDFPADLAPDLTLEMEVRVDPYQRTTVDYQIRPMNRGRYRFGRVHLKYASRLGLLWIVKKGGRPETIKVYPDLLRISQMNVRYSKSQQSGEIRKRNLGIEGTQFTGLRSYAVGDDIRKMDWKATARLDTPIVRTFSNEVDQPILLLLDAGRKMETRVQGLTKFDWALNSALAFATVSLNRGDQVGAAVFHQEIVRMVPTGSGPNHMRHLLETLHDVEPKSLEPDYERMFLRVSRHLKRRTLIIVFTDLIDPMTSRSLMKSLKLFSSHHLLILMTISDASLLALGNKMPQTAFEAYEKGVALDLLNLRRHSLMELSKSQGTVVIDVPPEKMDDSLIQQYLTIKLKNRL